MRRSLCCSSSLMEVTSMPVQRETTSSISSRVTIPEDIEEVVSRWTGIGVTSIKEDEQQKLLRYLRESRYRWKRRPICSAHGGREDFAFPCALLRNKNGPFRIRDWRWRFPCGGW